MSSVWTIMWIFENSLTELSNCGYLIMIPFHNNPTTQLSPIQGSLTVISSNEMIWPASCNSKHVEFNRNQIQFPKAFIQDLISVYINYHESPSKQVLMRSLSGVFVCPCSTYTVGIEDEKDDICPEYYFSL